MQPRIDSKPRVLQLSTVHPWDDNRIFRKICGSLVEDGYDVVLMAREAKSEAFDPPQGVELHVHRLEETPYQFREEVELVELLEHHGEERPYQSRGGVELIVQRVHLPVQRSRGGVELIVQRDHQRVHLPVQRLYAPSQLQKEHLGGAEGARSGRKEGGSNYPLLSLGCILNVF